MLWISSLLISRVRSALVICCRGSLYPFFCLLASSVVPAHIPHIHYEYRGVVQDLVLFRECRSPSSGSSSISERDREHKGPTEDVVQLVKGRLCPDDEAPQVATRRQLHTGQRFPRQPQLQSHKPNFTRSSSQHMRWSGNTIAGFSPPVMTKRRYSWRAPRQKDYPGSAATDLQQVEALHALQLNAGDIPEGARDAAVAAVHHQGPLASHVTPVAHLSLAAAQVAAGSCLLHICSHGSNNLSMHPITLEVQRREEEEVTSLHKGMGSMKTAASRHRFAICLPDQIVKWGARLVKLPASRAAQEPCAF